MKNITLLIVLVFVFFVSIFAAPKKEEPVQEVPVPKGQITMSDTANDDGSTVSMFFTPENDPHDIPKYYIDVTLSYGKDKTETETYEVINTNQRSMLSISTPGGNTKVFAQAYLLNEDGSKSAPFVTGEITSKAEWINTDRIKPFSFAVLFIILIIIVIGKAKKGAELFIRRLPGLEAIDDAIGRATEMGKPVFYIPGTSIIEDVATLAALNILRPVAQDVAKYETPLRVPIIDPIVLTVAQDVTKEAYISAGRPDLYNDGTVFLAAVGQFAYAGAVSGMMVREKPATVFLLGYFNAESLILAETANSVGAIQISGTDSTAQLPFFIAACDYTLIGEELYAASAYLSREPLLLGTLKAQDYLKGIFITLLAISLLLSIFGITVFANTFLNFRI